LWDRGYSEAWRPIVPSMLLELLSHQNAADMQFSHDPRFKFTVSRAIYKGMLRFLAYQQNRPYVVQPLPVDHFSISPIANNKARLEWKPVEDPLEPTATPNQYKVYKRVGNNGFDNGTLLNEPLFETEIEKDKIYSYKITAINEGGESFPSEILSVGISSQNSEYVLIVNKFNRISVPDFFDEGQMAGVAWWQDQGVPHIADIGFCGNQYDFNKNSPWLDDDSPGWGASYGNMEGQIIPGNTFDFSAVHGEAILANGYSFVSVSDEVFTSREYDTSPFRIVNIILGEEKSTARFESEQHDFTIFTPAFMGKIKEITDRGDGLLMSGAYVGTDFMLQQDTVARDFAKEVLKFKWRTNHASITGEVVGTDLTRHWFNRSFNFNTGYHPKIYTVEAPDAIEPEGNAVTIFRYGDNRSSAGVAYRGVYRTIVLGFPFETITDKTERKMLMRQVLSFLKKPVL
jgi:hypothetical protein